MSPALKRAISLLLRRSKRIEGFDQALVDDAIDKLRFAWRADRSRNELLLLRKKNAELTEQLRRIHRGEDQR